MRPARASPAGCLDHARSGSGDKLQVLDTREWQRAFGKFGETLLPILRQSRLDPVSPQSSQATFSSGLTVGDKEVRIMLGEQIGEETGQITGTRVLPDEGAGPKVEVSFQANGTLLGIQMSNMGTYVSVARPDGTLFGEGQGVSITEDGEVAAWRAQGVGRLTGHGMAASWRGALYFQTASERLARLNGMAAVYEYEMDESGKTADKTYEWK